MRILITGASGFIGRHLVAAAQTNKHQVTRFIHNEERAIRDDTIVGDLAALRSLPEGRFDAIIHAAALSWPGPYSVAELAHANVTGTARLIDAAVRAGVQHIVFLSSLSAFAPDPNAYGLTKLLAERMLFENSKFSSVSVRLPAIVGRGAARHFLARTAEAARANNDIHIHTPQRHFNNVLHINDLCRFILWNALIWGAPRPQHDIVNLATVDALPIRDVVDHFLLALQSRSRVLIDKPPLGPLPPAFIDTEHAVTHYGFNPYGLLDTMERYAKDLLT